MLKYKSIRIFWKKEKQIKSFYEIGFENLQDS